jgi:addiction module RelE/StbE family toxin
MLDRSNIYDYIESDNPAAALALDELFSQKAEQLATHPDLGRLGRVAGTRELVAHSHYVLIYDVTDSMIRVLNIVHTARQWPPEA